VVMHKISGTVAIKCRRCCRRIPAHQRHGMVSGLRTAQVVDAAQTEILRAKKIPGALLPRGSGGRKPGAFSRKPTPSWWPSACVAYPPRPCGCRRRR
jgi:hypothetical protein